MAEFEVDTDSKPVTLVRFSNGSVTSKVAVKSYTKEISEQEGTSQQQILTSQVNGISYVGQNFGPSNRFATDACEYYLGIHNKSSGKIRVVPASLIQLEPWFKEKEDADVTIATKTSREKQDALATDFGSGRVQKAVHRRIKDKLDEGMVASAAETAINSPSAYIEEDSEEMKSQSDAIPPYNIHAETPSEVYLLKDIVSPEVLSCLTEASSALTCSTKEDIALWRKEKTYFSHILDKVEALSEVPQARQFQAQCLMYLQYLMTFYLMKASMLRTKFPLPMDWPLPVRDHLLNTFTLEIQEAGRGIRRCVPTRLKDLALSHILVLCLKMDDFAVDTSKLIVDLKHSNKKLITHASFLGCKIKRLKAGQTFISKVVLQVPLTFPKVKDRATKTKILSQP